MKVLNIAIAVLNAANHASASSIDVAPTDDLQSILNSLPSGTTNVNLLPGTHLLTKPIALSPDAHNGLTFTGAGSDSPIKSKISGGRTLSMTKCDEADDSVWCGSTDDFDIDGANR